MNAFGFHQLQRAPADRWMARQAYDEDSDSATALSHHPLFGAGAAPGPLFADVTVSTHNAFNLPDLDSCRRPPIIDDDGDDESLIPAPPSRQYTEAASSQSQQPSTGTQPSGSTGRTFTSQESSDSTHPTKIKTDEIAGFWAHRLQPRPLNPPTPQAQRIGMLRPEDSPMSVVDVVVRAGLDTPNRGESATTPQRPRTTFAGMYSAHETGASSRASEGASSHSSSFMAAAPRELSPAFSSNPPVAATNEGRLVASNGKQYRTVQQYQQFKEGNAAPPSAQWRSSPPTAQCRSISTVMIVIVEFKMERRRRFRCSPEIAPSIVPDTWVVVQVENGGVDMGACVEVYPATERHAIPKHYGNGDVGNVIRLADDEDCRVLNEVIPAKEEAALAKAHQLVHFLHMPFTCIDAEFQFDLKVVSLYYTLTPQAFTSIIPNVSRLQRELGFTLKAKVHLEQLVPIGE